MVLMVRKVLLALPVLPEQMELTELTVHKALLVHKALKVLLVQTDRMVLMVHQLIKLH
jgi:hypothetical protein